MTYMNDFDITAAVQRYPAATNIGKAARILDRFKFEVDNNSDGWAHWKVPVVAAEKLMQLVQGRVPDTDANLKSALTPIKSFMTRKGVKAGMTLNFSEVR